MNSSCPAALQIMRLVDPSIFACMSICCVETIVTSTICGSPIATRVTSSTCIVCTCPVTSRIGGGVCGSSGATATGVAAGLVASSGTWARTDRTHAATSRQPRLRASPPRRRGVDGLFVNRDDFAFKTFVDLDAPDGSRWRTLQGLLAEEEF